MNNLWKPAAEPPPENVPVLVCEKFTRNANLEVTTIAYWGHPDQGRCTRIPQRWNVVANCSGWECEDDECNALYWMPLPEVPTE